MSDVILTPIGRVAYPKLAKAAPVVEGGEPRYSATLVFGPDVDLSGFRKKIEEFAKSKFEKGKFPKKFKYPFRPGTDRAGKEGFDDDDTFFEAWKYESRGRPNIVDAQKNELLPSDVYAGSFARIAVRPFVYNQKGNQGVSLSLEAVQKSADGEPIGYAPVDAQEVFDEIPDDLVETLS